jgi:hypothetical protein
VEWLWAILIFSLTLIENAASAVYTLGVVEKRPFLSALIGSHIDLLGTVAVISYVQDAAYTLPLFAGSFCGTYLGTQYLNPWIINRIRLKNLKKARLAKAEKAKTVPQVTESPEK